MRSWKQAGRADRSAEDELWTRFKTAQDAFFKARSEVLDAKDRELREHVVVKEQLLAEAEKLLPVTDARSARSAMRGILERWERAGAVPRDSQERLEGGLRKIEETLRKAEDSHWRRTNPEALSRARGTVEQIRSAIAQLETPARQGPGQGRPEGPAASRGGDRGAPEVLASRSRAHAGRALRLIRR